MTINPDNDPTTIYAFWANSIRARMQELLRINNRSVDVLFDYLLKSNGKMLRPKLVYLAASIYPHQDHIVRDIAVAVEFIHMASLLHDDVIDNATLRRGKESINSRWGNKVSVLGGDYLFAAAFNLINRHGLDKVMHNVTETIQIMCAGEIKQLSMTCSREIDENEYLDKTYKKTACLFASSCKVGALVSLMPDTETALLEKYGLYMGYAYQIIDDVLDLVADPDSLGKPVGSDLLEGNITLPVIYALNDETYGKALKDLVLKTGLKQESITLIVNILKKTGAIDQAIMRAQSFVDSGLSCLNELPDCQAVRELRAIGKYLLDSYYPELHKIESIKQEAYECQILLN